MYILGISCYYHDSAACLIKDGVVVAAADEERFTRKKHDNSFPKESALWCLKQANISIKNIDYIAFYEKPIVKFERMLSQYLSSWPRGFWSFYHAFPSWMKEKLRFPAKAKKYLKYKGDIIFVDHHMAHAASSYFCSNFDDATILTIDGVGEWTTTAIGYAKKNKIVLDKHIEFPDSLGLLYSTVTAFLGFKVNNDEYKVMGLAAYGNPIYEKEFQDIINVAEDGSFKLNMTYFDYEYKSKMPSKKFTKVFGKSRKPESEITQRDKDLAATLQKVVESIVFKILNNYSNTDVKSKNLCLSGGVALNSVLNGKIRDNTSYENIFIQPSAGDSGAAVGAALYLYYSVLGNKKLNSLSSIYLGPEFSNDEIKSFLDKNKIVYHYYEDKELLEKTASLIYNNFVIGWFQGRMEWGPRALGNRSILANPLNPKMQDILNVKVKHREQFRPFAPVVVEEQASKYFDCEHSVPYMLFVKPVNTKYREKLPSITHVDGSARLQTITKKQNAKYYGLIKEFEKLSSYPILINTSFNVRGQPIVCAPQDALDCVMNTEIDYLVIGNFIVSRQKNLNKVK